MRSTSSIMDVPRIDANLGKFSQACTVILSGLAFVFNQPLLVLITALALAISALFPAESPYRLLYKYVALPLHLLRPRIVEDDSSPHRFAQGIGAVFLITSSIVLLLTQGTIVGWILDLIVFVLSGINLIVGFCAGCFVYYHLGRLGLLPRVRYEGGFHWREVQV